MMRSFYRTVVVIELEASLLMIEASSTVVCGVCTTRTTQIYKMMV